MTTTPDDGHEDEQVQHHQRRQRDALVDVERRRRDEQQHQRQQLGHLVADVGDDLLVDPAADLDGVHERAEVVVGEDHPAGLLGHLAAAAHRHADVGLLQRGGVVDRVAGHRHDQPLLLHQPGEAQLVLRRDPAEDVQLRAAGAASSSSDSACSSAAADRARPEPERLADRLRGDGVVAGDHADVDAGAERRLDGGLRLGAQRVDDPHHADERQVVRRATSGRRSSPGARRPRRSGPRRRAPAGPSRPCARSRRRCPARASSIGTCEPLSGPPDAVQRASTTSGPPLTSWMTRSTPSTAHAVEGGHELVVGVERHLGETRVGPPRLLRVDAELRREHDERGLGRVADDRAVVGDGRVAVEHEPEASRVKSGTGTPATDRDRAGLAVALALDREPRVGRVDGRDHHLVHRQRPGLVGVDRARRAERLDVGQVLDHRLRIGELLGARATAGPRRTPACRSGSPRSPSPCRAAARR